MLETYIIMIQIIRGANKKETPQIENTLSKKPLFIAAVAVYTCSKSH